MLDTKCPNNLVYMENKKRVPTLAPFHFLKISVNNFLISVDYVFIENANVLDRNLDSRKTMAVTPDYRDTLLSHWVFFL